MAKPKGSGSASAGDETVAPTTTHGLARVTNVLALLLVKDMKQQVDAIAMLNRAGFQPREIAALLGTSPNTVSVALYQSKKNGKKKKAKGAGGKD